MRYVLLVFMLVFALFTETSFADCFKLTRRGGSTIVLTSIYNSLSMRVVPLLSDVPATYKAFSFIDSDTDSLGEVDMMNVESIVYSGIEGSCVGKVRLSNNQEFNFEASLPFTLESPTFNGLIPYNKVLKVEKYDCSN